MWAYFQVLEGPKAEVPSQTSSTKDLMPLETHRGTTGHVKKNRITQIGEYRQHRVKERLVSSKL